MSLQGPLVVISEKPPVGVHKALTKAGAFPIVETHWADAMAAIDSVQPAAVVIAETESIDGAAAEAFALQIKRAQPFIPVIAQVREDQALPFPGALTIAVDDQAERLAARLAAALRVRDLHAAVLRRLDALASEHASLPALPDSDPLDDATVLVLGRGRSYPTLSVAVGERAGVIGALSMEAAGKCLSAREIDGIVIGDGFGHRIVDAFLIVLAEDARFRNLPVGVLGKGASPNEMPNILHERDPMRLVERLLPFARLHAYDARLKRMLKSLELKGMLDPDTGLLNEIAFGEDLSRAIDQACERGGGLSIARFSFDRALDRRISMDAARIVSRLMRTVDFACRQDDGSILTVFTSTDLRAAHVVARRLAAVLKQTMLRWERDQPAVAPNVTLATLKPSDTVVTLMSRVAPPAVAAG
ncbi:MAG TPA: GGDEF domain-containing protein [Xanthobacteraceae bacterium]|nr:GGDEF domain-containing protein [Xanthobacteraceae bacterium]